MGVGNLGTVGAQPAAQSSHAQVKMDMKETMSLLQELVADMKSVDPQEMGGRESLAKADQGKEASQVGSRHVPTEQQEAGTTQQAQPLQQLVDQPSPEDLAFAALMQDEDDLAPGEKKGKKKSFSEKLKMLAELEGILQDVEFETPEQKELMKQFFENTGRMKQLRSNYARLEHQEKEYEQLLEEQEKQQAKDDKLAANKPKKAVAKKADIPTLDQTGGILITPVDIEDIQNPDAIVSEDADGSEDDSENQDQDDSEEQSQKTKGILKKRFEEKNGKET